MSRDTSFNIGQAIAMFIVLSLIVGVFALADGCGPTCPATPPPPPPENTVSTASSIITNNP